MSLWYCPVCGIIVKGQRPLGCPECHAWLLLPCIKHYKDPLANNYEMDIEYMESLR